MICLFEKIIKSCKTTNVEFIMLKEKLGICLYEENYNKKTIDKLWDEFLDESEEFFEELNKEIGKEPNKESNKESLDEDLMEIRSPKKDEDTTDWYDKNKFKKILTTIDSNNFNHKNKIGKLKFNDINNLINNIKNNTITETDAKQKLNALDEIKK